MCLEFRYENLNQVLEFCQGKARVPLHLAGDYTLMVQTNKGEQGAHYGDYILIDEHRNLSVVPLAEFKKKWKIVNTFK
jgi:hypothetical protein